MSSSTPKKAATPKRLGRGLDALLGGAGDAGSAGQVSVHERQARGTGLSHIALSGISPNRWQPRQHFDEAALQNLADSIRQSGLMQPIVVRSSGTEGRYELISGERRMRAAAMAGLSSVPAMVRNVSDRDMVALALVENLQRENLNIMEQAQALCRLVDEFKITHDQAARYVGQSRSAVSNILRLLELCAPVQSMLRKGELQMGHGRALLGLPEMQQLELAKKAVRGHWSVRVVEDAVQKMSASQAGSARPEPDADARRLERELADHLGTPVTIRKTGSEKGKIVVRYTSHEQLEGVLERIGLK